MVNMNTPDLTAAVEAAKRIRRLCEVHEYHAAGLLADGVALALLALAERAGVLESAIRDHRSQKADDRCIEDDDRLYSALGDGVKCDRRVGSKAEMLKNCERFIDRRCQGGHWPTYQELEAKVLALAAGREDDGEAVTLEWLLSIGFREGGSPHARPLYLDCVTFDDVKAGRVSICDWTESAVLGHKITTRGQLRSLLAGLGVSAGVCGTTEGRG